jgi:hypothetical protein
MPYLQKVTITFNTHGDNKDGDTLLHVFVKNRSVDTMRANNAGDYISNLLSFEAYELSGPFEINPYLAMGQNLGPGTEFGDPSSNTFELTLRSTPIPIEEVVLPVVNIHILPNGNDTWIFDYTIEFQFDDGSSFSWSSNRNGITGIILDQDNRNYSDICTENPFITLPPLYKAQSAALLERVCLEFHTEDDDANKDGDTVLNVHIVNRLSASAAQDIVVANNLLPGQEFSEGSTNRILFGAGGLPLAGSALRLQDIVLPQVFIHIVPNGNDRWRFDFQVTYIFSDGRTFSSRSGGIVLDQDRPKYGGVYQGGAFPNTMPVAGKPPANLADHRPLSKTISLSYLQQRFDEFINNRQGVPGQDPPIQRLRLHNTGVFNGSTLPESYYDLQSLVANPPPPGVLSPPGYEMPVRYNSNPTTIGQLTGTAGIGDLYLNDIRSQQLTFTVDPTARYPLAIKLDFDCTGPQETVGGFGGMNFLSFSVRISLSLDFDSARGRIDVLSWLPTITDDDQIGQFIDVKVVTTSSTDPGGTFQKKMREKIRDKLNGKDPYDGKTLRDRLNETANSWLLGGVLAGTAVTPCGSAGGGDGCVVSEAGVAGDDFAVTYTRTGRWFQPQPPADWPSGRRKPAKGFEPGTLANIDHMVVVTMENHSFDAMLGYLSLPPGRGGMGRGDVDGLKGVELNRLRSGQICPSFALQPLDTIMTPDPPHSPEPVHRAIDGGAMDGFAQSYADERGGAVAPRIMGFHTGANVPVYDALARDFAIGHRWFASHPGPTFCNRFYELTGMLNVDPEGFWEFENSSPLRPVFTPTIFDYLTEQKVSWTYFEHHYCYLRFFQKYTFDSANVRDFDDPEFGFANLARNGALPSVTFIDPHFIELPPKATCDGPPADVRAGQDFVRQVVEAVVASPKWSKTLLVVIYDEHGGFYDHVPPPLAVPVSPDTNLPPTYGVRVPAFVISPWVSPGSVFGHDGMQIGPGGVALSQARFGAGADARTPARTAASRGASAGGGTQRFPLVFDHTSILKTIARRFMSANPPYMGARYAAAADLSAVLGDTLHLDRFLPFIPYRFTYVASSKRLEVEDADTTSGAAVQQSVASDALAQKFSFEPAGHGHFYIRTHTGNLYLTADDSLQVHQQPKFPTQGHHTSATNPDRQRWRLTNTNVSAVQPNVFTVRNARFPRKVLQPAGASPEAGVPVVLGDAQPVRGPLQTPNPWLVTSPLLGSGAIVVNA